MTIKIYSKNQCVKCKMTKKYLDQHNVTYTEINIDDPDLTQKTGQTKDQIVNYIKDELELTTLPIVVTPTDYWGDYRLDKLRLLIKNQS